MDISTSTSTSGAQGGAVQLNSVSKANQMVASQQSKTLSSLGYSFGSHEPPSVTTPTYSPAIYAQAAQYQLYTQSGSLASLLGNHNALNAEPAPTAEADTEIHPVEEPHAAAHLDAKA